MTQAPSPLAQLPGDPMIWVLLVSELLVFGAGLAAFLAVRIGDPTEFADAQSALHPGWDQHRRSGDQRLAGSLRAGLL